MQTAADDCWLGKKGDELDTHRLLIVENYSNICRVLYKLLVVAYDVFALIRIVTRCEFGILFGYFICWFDLI